MRRLIFWDFPRATWQYDLVVGLILIFIFATPRDLFHDQRKAASVILMAPNQFYIASELLDHIPPPDRLAAASSAIHKQMGKNWKVTKVEPLRDEAEQEIKGFIAFTSQPN